MNLYEVGDKVYLKSSADKGAADPVIIKTVMITEFDPNFPIIKYKTSGILQFKNTVYFEKELITLATAKTTATVFLNAEIVKLQAQIVVIAAL